MTAPAVTVAKSSGKERFSFRRVLPFVQAAIFIGFFFTGQALDREINAEWEISRTARAIQEEKKGWTVYLDLTKKPDGRFPYPLYQWEYVFGSGNCIYPCLPLGMGWPAALSSPAFLCTGVVVWAIPGDVPHWVVLFLTGVGISIFWYFVGLWLDRRLGWIPTPCKPYPRLARAGQAAILAFVLLHIYYMPGDMYHFWGEIWFSLLLWSGFGVYVLGRAIRRWENLEQAARDS